MPENLLRKTVLPLAAAGLLLGMAPGVAHAEQGVDVASWQHPGGAGVNWDAVGNSGHGFAMVKATEGTWYTNPYFFQDALGVLGAGMALGTYHYADVTASPEAQAAFYAATVLGQSAPMTLPPVIDFEDGKGLPPGQLIDWLHRYLDKVEQLTGRTPIIYTYPSFWRNQMANTTEFSRYPLWIADYTGGSGPNYPLPGGWNHWAFWQYSSQGSVPGIVGDVDLNTTSMPLDQIASGQGAGIFGSLQQIRQMDPTGTVESIIDGAMQSLSSSLGSLGSGSQSLGSASESWGSRQMQPGS